MLGGPELVALALIVGVLCFAVTASVLLMRSRNAAAAREAAAQREISMLRAQNDRVAALLHSEPHVVVVWDASSDDPEVLGDATLLVPNSAPNGVLAFDAWLDMEQSHLLTRAIDALRFGGVPFLILLTTRAGQPLEASGRAMGGQAVLRLRDVSGMQREVAELLARQAALTGELQLLHALVDALPAPAWLRDGTGRLKLVNPAYARAVSASDAREAVQCGLELIEPGDELSRARAAYTPFTGRLGGVVAGERCHFAVL
jgi:PAS domain-containing protein